MKAVPLQENTSSSSSSHHHQRLERVRLANSRLGKRADEATRGRSLRLVALDAELARLGDELLHRKSTVQFDICDDDCGESKDVSELIRFGAFQAPNAAEAIGCTGTDKGTKDKEHERGRRQARVACGDYVTRSPSRPTSAGRTSRSLSLPPI